jgi:hypothetical protein
MAQVDTFETTTLDQVNEIYANGRVQLEGLGTTIGDECTAIGEQYATTYEGFEHCTENGFWDGDLSERRAYAQAKAARKTAKGKHDGIVDAAKKRAREIVRNGRKSNRCQVITTASNTRKELDETLAQLTATIESSREHAIAQANSTRTSLVAAIENALDATLRQLNQQEHDQRQMIDDTCYLQQVVQEQMAHTAASSLQSVVGNAASTLHDSLFTLRAQFASNVSPDPKALDEALTSVSVNVDAALDGLQQGLFAGTTSSLDKLATSLDAGLNALDELVASNDETATALLNGFGAGMGAIAGQDNFATQRAGFSQLVQQATSGGTDALQQMFDGMREGCGKTLEDSRKSLKQAGDDLEKTLRKSKVGIECEITKAADEAASHEAPAWKMLVAILLIIVVIVIVLVSMAIVTALTAGAGLAAILAVGVLVGALVGAVTSALITMAINLWTNQDVMQGVGEAMIMGAITGAAGGLLGAGIGAVVGKVAGVALSAGAKQIVTLILSTVIIDVGVQLYQGGGSLRKFSIRQLAIDLAIAFVFHKVGSAMHSTAPVPEGGVPGAPTVEPPAVESPVPAAAPEATLVEPTPTTPTPPEPTPTEPPPTQPTPPEPTPTEPTPTQPTPPEPTPTEPTPTQLTPPEPTPTEPTPTQPAPPEPTPTEPTPTEPTATEPTPTEEQHGSPAEEEGQNRRRDPGGRRARGAASRKGIEARKKIAYERMSNGEYDPLQDVLTPDERAQFLDSEGKELPKDIDWHHTQQSSADPGMADVPEHIQPLRIREHIHGEHLGRPGNVPTAGIKGDVTTPTKPIFDPNAPEVQTGRVSPNEPPAEPTLGEEGFSEGDFSKRRSPNFRDIGRVRDPVYSGQYDYQIPTEGGVYRREIATGRWTFFPR